MSKPYDSTRSNRRISKRRAQQSHDPINWDVINSKTITDLIQSATRSGGAVRFGATRDHGALALGVYGDGEPYTEYFRDPDEFDDFTQELINVFNMMADHGE